MVSSIYTQHRAEHYYISLNFQPSIDSEDDLRPRCWNISHSFSGSFHPDDQINRGTPKHVKHTQSNQLSRQFFFSQLTEIFLVNEHWLLSRSTRNLELTFHTRSEKEKEPFNALRMQPELENQWELVKRQCSAIVFFADIIRVTAVLVFSLEFDRIINFMASLG